MNGSDRTTLRADFVVTMDDEKPIEDGAIIVQAGKFADVGPYNEIAEKYPDSTLIDLGKTILLPGLINAHCHLDYTDFRGKINFRGSFSKWVLDIIALKRKFDKEGDYVRSIRNGLEESLRYGTTTIFEVSSSYKYEEAASDFPIKSFLFYEVLGLNPLAVKRTIGNLADSFDKKHSANVLGKGVSPHAVYSMSKRLLKSIVDFIQTRECLSTIHIAESREEAEFYRKLKADSPVKYLDSTGFFSPSTLGIHLNYVSDEDMGILSRNGVSIVHCPGSHQFFHHEEFPAEKFYDRGINICIGTDSLASNDSLNLFREMRIFQKNHPRFSSEQILAMTTVNPAKFLKLDCKIGKISVGFDADVVGIPSKQCNVEEVYDTILSYDGEVGFLMVDGKITKKT